MTAISANGAKGILIRTEHGYMFRIYDSEHNFVDYELHHTDLSVTITDADAYFYQDNTNRLDHAPSTL